MAMLVKGSDPSLKNTVKSSRKTLAHCFTVAHNRLRSELETTKKKDPKQRAAVDQFLNAGTKLTDLAQKCQELSNEAEDKANNAARLWTTLDQLKGAADVFLQFAPESVSLVWFGISSLITIGNAKVQTKLLICGTCDSIANIVADCIRWDNRMEQIEASQSDNVSDFEIWESDIPNLIFHILDFLWHAMPHMDQSRAKRLGSTLKDLFTRELQQKVDVLLSTYEEILNNAKAHFEESVFRETLQTSLKIDQITKDIKQYMSIGPSVMDALQRQILLAELDRHREEVRNSFSQSSQLYFSALVDRSNKITRDRAGRLAGSWVFKEDAYIDWKADTSNTTILCLKGPRGHGKSVAMMSIQKDILGHSTATDTILLCHFFFKKGEQDMQRTRTALESILYQLLNSQQLRKDHTAILDVIQILNPGFGDTEKGTGGTQSQDSNRAGSLLNNLSTLSDAIRFVAAAIPCRVYLMFDALDECSDRKEQNLAQHLKTLALSAKEANLRIIFSVRSNVEIESELVEVSNYQGRRGSTTAREQSLPEELEFIEATQEKNSLDLREYLVCDVGEVLKRQIDQNKYMTFYHSKLTNIVNVIHDKAKGDFTLARMIVANLQQPSKDALEKRITQLPSAIGDIYMASLEALTPDEQEFVIAALHWTVYTVASVNVLEISDHYREVYKSITTNTHSHPQDDIRLADEEPLYQDPFDRPEIKEFIYHIENAGRDFFRLNKATGVVSVDISIREWVQEEDSSVSKSANKESRGLIRTRDKKGNTVFVLTPSFIRYGDNLSALFNEREAHLKIAINILRALNSENFQKEHMTWKPAADSAEKRRYEIDHWHDHIRILQKWWNKESLNDSWWTELLEQLYTFIRPENWFICSLQCEWPKAQSKWGKSFDGDIKEYHKEYMRRLFDDPIHLACKLGLSLIVDLLLHDDRKGCTSGQINGPESPPKFNQFRERSRPLLKHRIETFTENYLEKSFSFEEATEWLPKLDIDELKKHLHILADEQATLPVQDPDAYNETQDPDLIRQLQSELDLLDPSEYCMTPMCDTYDTQGKVPLELAAASPGVVKRLIDDGADINRKSRTISDSIFKIFLDISMIVSTPKEPILLILERAYSVLDGEDEKTMLPLLLKSASILVSEGANLDVQESDTHKRTLLHIAAQLRDLHFFKLLCVSGDWDVHKKDADERTPLHHLFERPRPEDPVQIRDVLSICRILVQMQASDKDLPNAEDRSSKNALAYAVYGGFVEAVQLLKDLGANIHDLDSSGGNCFHHLAQNKAPIDPETDIKIANILFDSGVDFAHRRRFTSENDHTETPLADALRAQKWHLARYFQLKYEETAQNESTMLLKRGDDGSNILHDVAKAATNTEEYVLFLKYLVTILEKYTDLKSLVQERDTKLNTPLHYVAAECSPQALKYIFSLGPDALVGSRNADGLTPLDIAAHRIFRLASQMIEDPMMSIEDIDESVIQDTSTVIAQFYYLLSVTKASEFSFSFLRTDLFQDKMSKITPRYRLEDIKVTMDKIFSLLDTKKLFNVLTQNHPSRDIFGWSLFDVLFANKITVISPPIAHCQPPAGVDCYARPTEMYPVEATPMNISDDGLEVYASDPYPEPSRSKLKDYRILLKSKQPVPPVNKTFYFEIEISPKANFDNGHLEIGFHEEFNFMKANFTYNTTGHISINHGIGCVEWPENRHVQHGSSRGIRHEYFPTTKLVSLGCGINPLDHTVFTTVNGKILEAIWRVEPRRYFPVVRIKRYFKGVRINLGATPFSLKEANDPDWLWDWRAVESDWGGVQELGSGRYEGKRRLRKSVWL